MTLKTKPSNIPGFVWLEQNAAKASEWGALARAGHSVYHLVRSQGFGWGGRIMIDDIEYSYDNARLKFNS